MNKHTENIMKGGAMATGACCMIPVIILALFVILVVIAAW